MTADLLQEEVHSACSLASFCHLWCSEFLMASFSFTVSGTQAQRDKERCKIHPKHWAVRCIHDEQTVYKCTIFTPRSTIFFILCSIFTCDLVQDATRGLTEIITHVHQCASTEKRKFCHFVAAQKWWLKEKHCGCGWTQVISSDKGLLSPSMIHCWLWGHMHVISNFYIHKMSLRRRETVNIKMP